MKPHILIVTAPADITAKRVERELQRRGAEVSRFDLADFPVHAQVSASFESERASLQLHLPERTVPLDCLTAIWFRKPGAPTAAPEITDPAMREMFESESADFLTSIWDVTGCVLLPAALDVLLRAQRKAPQLQRACALGFRVPPTLFTNDPREFLSCYRRHEGRLVSKMTSGINFYEYARGDFGRYTELVSTRDVGYAQSVKYCPIILQAYVPKRLELRITVVGSRVFAAEIHSQVTNHTMHDWRRYDLGSTPHRKHELPDDIARLCIRLVQDMGLRYGAIDMILTPDGEYVFLELNPAGEYDWIEQLTGLPISAAIADVLLGRDQPATHAMGLQSEENCHA